MGRKTPYSNTLVIGGLGVFSNLIISAFGFSYLQTQLLNITQGAVTIMVMIGGAWMTTWTKQTAIIMHVSELNFLSIPIVHNSMYSC